MAKKPPKERLTESGFRGKNIPSQAEKALFAARLAARHGLSQGFARTLLGVGNPNATAGDIVAALIAWAEVLPRRNE